jgi:hypothetical protein
VVKFGELVARMTLANAVVDSLGAAKPQELGEIDEEMHIIAVVYFQVSVDKEGIQKDDVGAMGS